MLWDTSGDLPMLLSDGTNSFIYGADGLSLSQFDSAGNTSWFAHDTQGNTRMLMRNDGVTTGSFDYDAYGTNNNAFGYKDTPLKFQSQYEDKETGLLYLRARYHDPKTNQFLSVDPLAAQTRSMYGYADNDAVNYGDPTGLCIGFGCDIGRTEIGRGIADFSAGVVNGVTLGNGKAVFGALGLGGNFNSLALSITRWAASQGCLLCREDLQTQLQKPLAERGQCGLGNGACNPLV